MRVLCLLILCGLCFQAAAAEVPLASDSVDLAFAEDLALQNDLTLQAHRAALQVARVQLEAAWGIEDPELRLGYGDSHSPSEGTSPSSDAEQYEVALRVFPPNVWTAGASKDAARAAMKAEEAALRLAEQSVVNIVRSLYAELVYLRGDIKLVEQMISAHREYRTAVRAMQERNEVTSLVVVKVGLDYLEAVAERDVLRQQLRRATSELSALTGLKGLAESALQPESDSLVAHAEKLNVQSLQEMALEARADIGVLTWQLGVADAGMDVARRRRWPWLSHLQVSMQEEQGDSEDEAWGVQAAINIPVFSYFSAGEEDVLEADASRMRSELVAARAAVVREVQVAWDTLQAALDNAREYQQDMAPLVEDMKAALETAEADVGLGIDMQMEVKEGLITAGRSRLLSDYSLKQAILALEQALGADLPR